MRKRPSTSRRRPRARKKSSEPDTSFMERNLDATLRLCTILARIGSLGLFLAFMAVLGGSIRALNSEGRLSLLEEISPAIPIALIGWLVPTYLSRIGLLLADIRISMMLAAKRVETGAQPLPE